MRLALRLVVVETVAVAPAARGEEQGHGIVFFAVGGGAGGAWRAVRGHRPGEVAVVGVLRVGDEHVGVGPVPEGVELALVAELHGDHHAVGHAFGAGVVVRPVGHVGERAVGVRAGFEVDALAESVAVEELLEGAVDLGLRVGGGVAGLGEEVAVVVGGVGAGAVAGEGWMAGACAAMTLALKRARRRAQSFTAPLDHGERADGQS